MLRSPGSDAEAYVNLCAGILYQAVKDINTDAEGKQSIEARAWLVHDPFAKTLIRYLTMEREFQEYLFGKEQEVDEQEFDEQQILGFE